MGPEPEMNREGGTRGGVASHIEKKMMPRVPALGKGKRCKRTDL
jgi:hypothetical protein